MLRSTRWRPRTTFCTLPLDAHLAPVRAEERRARSTVSHRRSSTPTSEVGRRLPRISCVDVAFCAGFVRSRSFPRVLPHPARRPLSFALSATLRAFLKRRQLIGSPPAHHLSPARIADVQSARPPGLSYTMTNVSHHRAFVIQHEWPDGMHPGVHNHARRPSFIAVRDESRPACRQTKVIDCASLYVSPISPPLVRPKLWRASGVYDLATFRA